MIASLMMYARPELETATARYWADIRAALATRRITAPEVLSNDADAFDVWTAPDLVLSQTCGMPYRLWLHEQVTLIGTPDFAVEGCAPGYYTSAVAVRADDTRETLLDFSTARLAYNQTFSQSGFAALHALVSPMGFWFEDRMQTHGHVQSARAVAEGRADIAALDAVTWRLIQRYDPWAENLRVLAWTAPSPGLPYIAARGADAAATFDAVSTAIAGLDAQDRIDLGLQGLIHIPAEAYLAIPNPPDQPDDPPALRRQAM